MTAKDLGQQIEDRLREQDDENKPMVRVVSGKESLKPDYTCGSCAFAWIADDGEGLATGECRAHPPGSDMDIDGWPAVDSSLWCGEYRFWPKHLTPRGVEEIERMRAEKEAEDG